MGCRRAIDWRTGYGDEIEDSRGDRCGRWPIGTCLLRHNGLKDQFPARDGTAGNGSCVFTALGLNGQRCGHLPEQDAQTENAKPPTHGKIGLAETRLVV